MIDQRFFDRSKIFVCAAACACRIEVAPKPATRLHAFDHLCAARLRFKIFEIRLR
jgi:hypothetical protein